MKRKDEVDEYLERFRREVLPKIEGSVATIALLRTKPDPKMCLEIGAAILLDKPLIVVASPGQDIPKALAKIASAVLVGEFTDPAFKKRLTAAMEEIMKVPRAT